MKRKKRAKVAPKAKHNKKLPLFIVISLTLILIFILAATIYKLVEIALLNKPAPIFPKLEISLAEAPIEQINANSKEIKYPHNAITITTDKESVTYENIENKGRGNHTWNQIKKPYQIKFTENTSLFDSKEARKWILLANYEDPTHLRNNIAFYISNILKSTYTPHGNYVELYTDNQYHGLYYLTEKIEIGKNRVNLRDEKGILVELDDSYGKTDDCIYDAKKNCIVMKGFVNEDLSDDATDSFISSLNSLYFSIRKKNFDAIKNLIDVDSFANYYILNEFIANPDAYSSSFFMYKDGDNDKIHAGPGWDFDISLGNKNWSTEEIPIDEVHSPFNSMLLKDHMDNVTSRGTPYGSAILYNLMEVPEFETYVKEIYRSTLSNRKEELLAYIKSQADYIHPAALRDQERWKLKTNFDEEVDYLTDWIAKRYEHFEKTYGVNSSIEEPEIKN